MTEYTFPKTASGWQLSVEMVMNVLTRKEDLLRRITFINPSGYKHENEIPTAYIDLAGLKEIRDMVSKSAILERARTELLGRLTEVVESMEKKEKEWKAKHPTYKIKTEGRFEITIISEINPLTKKPEFFDYYFVKDGREFNLVHPRQYTERFTMLPQERDEVRKAISGAKIPENIRAKALENLDRQVAESKKPPKNLIFR